ncbi:MAG: class I SAM-dependent methyltransferase [Bacteroidota bacterium]
MRTIIKVRLSFLHHFMAHEEQKQFWDNEGGDFWAAYSEKLDLFFEPVSEAILELAEISPEDHVLDIGCGPGTLTLSAMKQAKSATGVDLSSRLISMAEEKALNLGLPATFAVADATTYKPLKAPTLILSRFGLMFFDHPEEAFSTFRTETVKKSRMVFASWAPISQNPWIMETLEVVQPLLLEPLPTPKLDKPGPFSLSEPEHVKVILTQAGWGNVSINLWENQMGSSVSSPYEAAEFFCHISPACRAAINQGIEEDIVKERLLQLYQSKLVRDGKLTFHGAALIVKATSG